MWPRAYFTGAYFAPSYWEPLGGEYVPPEPSDLFLLLIFSDEG